jgi:GT2 family glycosyltransferase
MHPRVTAIVVAHKGAGHLRRTLGSLQAQTRPADAVIVLDMSSSREISEVVTEFGPTHFLSTTERLPFGAAVATASRVAPPPETEHEWLWFLAQDTAPEPQTLERLLGTIEVSPSVAIAGPKLVDWNDTSLIRELGQSMTPLGTSVSLVEDELDQAQHDGLSDVLGVPSAGMIVRHTAWEKLGGFDQGLPTVDDGLDLSVRARLAGFRVVLVPTALMAMAGDGLSGPVQTTRWGGRRPLYRARRSEQLHRRMVYAPAGVLVFHWLSLVPLAIIRSLGWLLGKQPGAIGGEFAAAFATAFGAGHVGEARSRLARTKTVGWSAIAPLRIPQGEVRRARALRREAALIRSRGERRELNFFSGGGAWAVLVMLLASLAIFAPLLGGSTVQGGSLLPLSDGVAALWGNLGYGWRDIGLGFVGAADPFTGILAILGSITFWQPSFSLLLLWFAAMPLAALGAWFCATRVTHRAGLRALFAIAWALAPMLLDALQTGRPAAVIVHILLPWLFFAGLAARRSWAASASTALLAAGVIAASPSLAPALAVIWLIWLAFSGRRISHVIGVPIPTLALFAPLIWQQGSRGNWLALLADPGAPVLGLQTHPLQLALGFPDGLLGGWHELTGALNLPDIAPVYILPVLFAPLAILAILALFLRGTIRATLTLVVALLGFATAVGSVLLWLTISGSQVVPIWPGAGLSLYWLGLIAAATMGLTALGRFAIAPAWIAVLTLAAAVVPTAAALPFGFSAISAGRTSALPAFVTAEAAQHPRIGTLVLTPQPGGGLGATVVRGSGTALDDQSTLAATGTELTAGDKSIATLAGNLASSSGLDASTELTRYGINFVLLAPAATTLELSGDAPVTAAATATGDRAETALDGNSLLDQVGTTDHGTLWNVTGTTTAVAPAAAIPANASGLVRPLVLVGQGLVIGLTLLLSIPTGRAERGDLRRATAADLAARRARAAGSGPDDEEITEQADDTAIDSAESPAEPGEPSLTSGAVPAGAAAAVEGPDATGADVVGSEGKMSGAQESAGETPVETDTDEGGESGAEPAVTDDGAESVPAESVPAESVPAESVPAESVPAESVPAETVPDESAPSEAGAQANSGEPGPERDAASSASDGHSNTGTSADADEEEAVKEEHAEVIEGGSIDPANPEGTAHGNDAIAEDGATADGATDGGDSPVTDESIESSSLTEQSTPVEGISEPPSSEPADTPKSPGQEGRDGE